MSTQTREARTEILIVNGAFRANQQDDLLAMSDELFDTVEAQAIKANAADGTTLPGPQGGTGGASKSDSNTPTEASGTTEGDVDGTHLEDDEKGSCPHCGAVKANENVILDVPSFIANAPAGIRDSMQEMYNAHEAKRLNLIKGLKANGRCQFTDEELGGKSMVELNKLASLGAVKTDFSGQAGAPKTNEAKRTGFAPPVPKMDFSNRK